MAGEKDKEKAKGGAATLAPEVTEQVRGLFTEVVEKALKPIGDKVGAIETGVTDLKGRIEKVEQAPALRVDADGKPIPFGDGTGTKGGEGDGKGPALVRKTGDQYYSLANIGRAAIEKDFKHAPLEHEVSNILKSLGFPHGSDGAWLVPLGLKFLPDMGQKADDLRKLLKDAFWVPAFDPEEYRALAKGVFMKAMDPLQETQGGSLIPYPERGELIELLRAQIVYTQAGAQFIPLPPGGLDYPEETGGITFAWRKLGTTGAITETSPTTGSVKLSPKELTGLSKLPNSLIRFSRPAAEALVRRALSADAALAADLGYGEGQGGTAPQGIIWYPRSTNADVPERGKVTKHIATTVGANGDTFEPEDAELMIANVEEAPDAEGPTAWIMRPRKFRNIANARADAVSAGDKKGPFLFPVTRGAMSNAVEKELDGYRVATSTQVSKARAKGSGTALTYILLGNFRRMVVGVVGALELAVSTESAFRENATEFRAVLYTDSALLHPQSITITDQLIV